MIATVLIMIVVPVFYAIFFRVPYEDLKPVLSGRGEPAVAPAKA